VKHAQKLVQLYIMDFIVYIAQTVEMYRVLMH